MKLLLDTHVWLRAISRPERMHPDVRHAVEDEGNAVFLSAASSWEIAIKHRLGKLPLPCPPREFVESRLVRDGIRALSVEHRHALDVADLPDHHRDPFDRLLIAQARGEGMRLVTVDPAVEPYDVAILWADRPMA